MDDDKIKQNGVPLRAMMLILATPIVVFAFLLIVVPYGVHTLQSDSGVCGKEFHGVITPIASLQADKNIEGQFFLGMGSIRTERVYVAYTGNNQIGYSLIERPISQSLLFEDTNETPYIEDMRVLVCTSYGYEMIDQYKIHVPVGTIKMEYSI